MHRYSDVKLSSTFEGNGHFMEGGGRGGVVKLFFGEVQMSVHIIACRDHSSVHEISSSSQCYTNIY